MVGIEWQMINMTFFSDILGDIAMATVAKMGQIYLPMHLSLCHSDTEWAIAMSALTA